MTNHGGTVALDAVVERWHEVCRHDPLLPRSAEVVGPEPLAATVLDLVRRPPASEWTIPRGLEDVAREFASRNTPLEVAVEELVCLADAIRPFLDADHDAEWRVRNLLDRAITVVVHDAVDHLQEEALTDHLTGLRNRRALQRELRRELLGARRRGQPLSVVMLDLVGLKAVNDAQGHLAGDGLLITMAGALTSALRRSDVAYRVGGDEFVVVAPDANEHDVGGLVARVAERAPRFGWGAATFPTDGEDERALLAFADQRLLEGRIRDRTPPRGTSIDLTDASGLAAE